MLALGDVLRTANVTVYMAASTGRSRALARVRLSSPVIIQQVQNMTGMSVSKLKTFNCRC